MREVILAKSAGFCYGVRRAVEMAQREAERGSSCVMLGSIIHNLSLIHIFLPFRAGRSFTGQLRAFCVLLD